MQKIISGKVRDVYEIDDNHLVIVTTDRISAFDVILSKPVKDKGKVLNALSLEDICLETCGVPIKMEKSSAG